MITVKSTDTESPTTADSTFLHSIVNVTEAALLGLRPQTSAPTFYV